MRRFLKSLFGKKTGTIRNAPTASRTRLGLTALEAREVPASLIDGVLVINGTSGNDTVTVSNTTIAGPVVNGWTVITPAVRVVENGNTFTFARSAITANQVEFRGHDGNDWFDNNVDTLFAYVEGGIGNDTLYGANGDDVIIGEVGDDIIYGGGGADYLFGETGADDLYGEGGDDHIYGGNGNDYLSGGDGDDEVNGERDDDVVVGGAGNDRVYGDSGDDDLYGGSGDDFLGGGTGRDELFGGSGRDGLLGGLGSEGDNLTGGSDQDRFLDHRPLFPSSTNTIESHLDREPADAVVDFEDSLIQPIITETGLDNLLGWSWTESQIESVDKALAKLQFATNSIRLLEYPSRLLSIPLKFVAHGGMMFGSSIQAGYSPQNSSVHHLTEVAMVSDLSIQRTVIHQIALTWEAGNPNRHAWLALSGWEAHIPGWHDVYPPAGKVRSTDGGWWRNSNAQFASTAGRANPAADFATSWVAFFGLGGTQVATKMAHVQGFMDYIEGLG